jgi:hypothetical protein
MMQYKPLFVIYRIAGLAGGLAAAILAYFRLHIIYVILGSIIVVMLLRTYFGI